MIAHVSKWVLPVSQPPIRDGAVVVRGREIRAVGPAQEVLSGFKGLICDHGDGAVLPGLVNCHAHLEFSALAGHIPPQKRWEEWLKKTLAKREALDPAQVDQGIIQGISALRQSGTALVGEVSNTGASLPHLEDSSLEYHLFYECLGFNLKEQLDLSESFGFFGEAGVNENPRISAAAHAPYSVSAALFQAVKCWNGDSRPQTVHLGECRAELDFLSKGNGFFKDLLKSRGRWLDDFCPPGPSPVSYLHDLEFLGPRTLAVHGVWLAEPDCRLLAQSGTWLVLCPRANRYTGAGVPPVDRLIGSGVNLALGTDSLAGNWDLNLFGEMRWLHRNFPAYPGDLWLRLGTLNGAQALGRGQDLGSLEAGKKAVLGFVPLKGASDDIWRELFTNGASGKFRWLS
ncbi:MAG: amidohydrolase family protein [Deltaproteobacteria bacterium]|nr:amidohydrolase family protein [Deltaproteobacteria bacterium]